MPRPIADYGRLAAAIYDELTAAKFSPDELTKLSQTIYAGVPLQWAIDRKKLPQEVLAKLFRLAQRLDTHFEKVPQPTEDQQAEGQQAKGQQDSPSTTSDTEQQAAPSEPSGSNKADGEAPSSEAATRPETSETPSETASEPEASETSSPAAPEVSGAPAITATEVDAETALSNTGNQQGPDGADHTKASHASDASGEPRPFDEADLEAATLDAASRSKIEVRDVSKW